MIMPCLWGVGLLWTQDLSILPVIPQKASASTLPAVWGGGRGPIDLHVSFPKTGCQCSLPSEEAFQIKQGWGIWGPGCL